MKDINLFPAKDSIFLKKVHSKSNVGRNDECDGYLIDSSEKEARRIIDSLKGSKKIIALIGGDDAFNRRAIETLKINYLVSPEKSFKRDTLKQRDSGINHVVAKEAAKKNISLVINFSEISQLNGKEKALRIGRIIQNILVCKKAKCSLKIASFGRNEEEAIREIERRAFCEGLGMKTNDSRDSISFK